MNRQQAIKTRTIPFVFSDETRDSYGTVLPVKGWDLSTFNKMGVALYNHSSFGSDPDNVIGTARAWVEGNKLIGEITFEKEDINPKAEKVFQKVLAGTIKGCSVGFRTMERGEWGKGEEAYDGKKPTYYYGRRSLLEISVTPIPANPNAKVRSVHAQKSDEEPTGEMEYLVGEVRSFDPDTEGDEEEQRQAEAEKESALLRANAAMAEADALMAISEN